MLAILVSGALRDFDTLWKTLRDELIANDLECSLFLHTWSRNYDTTRPLLRDGKANKFVGLKFDGYGTYISRPYPVTEDIIKSFYPKSFKIESFELFSEATLSKLSSDFPRELSVNVVNSLGMYYGMSRVANLLREDSQFKAYTHFIRLRTDFKLPLPSIFEVMSSNKLMFYGKGAATDFGYISDQCFGGEIRNLVAMDAFDTFIAYVKENGWYLPSRKVMYAETPLAFHLRRKLELGDEQLIFRTEVGMLVRPLIAKPARSQLLIESVSVLRHNRLVLKQKFFFLLSHIKRKFTK